MGAPRCSCVGGPGGHSSCRCCPLAAIPSPSVKQWRQDTRAGRGYRQPRTNDSDAGRQQGMGATLRYRPTTSRIDLLRSYGGNVEGRQPATPKRINEYHAEITQILWLEDKIIMAVSHSLKPLAGYSLQFIAATSSHLVGNGITNRETNRMDLSRQTKHLPRCDHSTNQLSRIIPQMQLNSIPSTTLSIQETVLDENLETTTATQDGKDSPPAASPQRKPNRFY